MRRRPVELADLTRTLLDKARGLGDRDWVLDGSGQGHVHVDEQRVTQAVLQLADNAVKHTDAGDRIALGSGHDGRTRPAVGATTPATACARRTGT